MDANAPAFELPADAVEAVEEVVPENGVEEELPPSPRAESYEPATSLDVASSMLPGLLAAEKSQPQAAAVRRRVWATRFLPEHLYEHYAAQAAVTLAALPPAHPRIRELPSQYINILPLDAGWDGEGAAAAVSGSYGYATSLYKGISTEDGIAYALRRVENVRAPPSVLTAVVGAWAKAAHPSIVRLRGITGTRGAGGGPGGGGGGPGALVFVHDYYPGARSLQALYTTTRGPAVPERTLWSYACQLVLGLRAAHEADLSFRGLSAAHVLVSSSNRLRIGGSGVLDVLEADTKKPLAELQQGDVLSLGHLLLQLATRSPAPHAGIEAALEGVKAGYSVALYTLIVLLLSKPLPIGEVARLLAPQMTAELEALYDHADAASELLGREADNGRLLRLLVKLGFVNERPSHEGDPAWGETGDRYLLKLYRDFVFHQASEEGKPVLDLAHVVESLNALDAGAADRRILLSSRDGGTLLVATYAQLRRALNASFDELRTAAYQHGAGAAANAAAAAAAGGAAAAAAAFVEPGRAVPAAVRRARVAAAGTAAAGAYGHGAGHGGAASSNAHTAAAATASLLAAAAAAGGLGAAVGGFDAAALAGGALGMGVGGGAAYGGGEGQGASEGAYHPETRESWGMGAGAAGAGADGSFDGAAAAADDAAASGGYGDAVGAAGGAEGYEGHAMQAAAAAAAAAGGHYPGDAGSGAARSVEGGVYSSYSSPQQRQGYPAHGGEMQPPLPPPEHAYGQHQQQQQQAAVYQTTGPARFAGGGSAYAGGAAQPPLPPPLPPADEGYGAHPHPHHAHPHSYPAGGGGGGSAGFEGHLPQQQQQQQGQQGHYYPGPGVAAAGTGAGHYSHGHGLPPFPPLPPADAAAAHLNAGAAEFRPSWAM